MLYYIKSPAFGLYWNGLGMTTHEGRAAILTPGDLPDALDRARYIAPDAQEFHIDKTYQPAYQHRRTNDNQTDQTGL